MARTAHPTCSIFNSGLPPLPVWAGGRGRERRAGEVRARRVAAPVKPPAPLQRKDIERVTSRDDDRMETLIQDIHFAVRSFIKSPGFAVVAVLCLAIGIGANTTIFSVISAMLLRPFPYADPDRIVAPHETKVKNDIERAGFSYLDYRDLLEQSAAFSQIAAQTGRSLAFACSEEPEGVEGAGISAGLFALLGVKPARGGNFRAGED